MKKLDGRFVKQWNKSIDVSKLIQLRVFPRFGFNRKLSTEQLFFLVSHQRNDVHEKKHYSKRHLKKRAMFYGEKKNVLQKQ